MQRFDDPSVFTYDHDHKSYENVFRGLLFPGHNVEMCVLQFSLEIQHESLIRLSMTFYLLAFGILWSWP